MSGSKDGLGDNAGVTEKADGWWTAGIARTW